MKRLSLNGKDFGCPDNWSEITVEQLLKIISEPLKPMDAIVICTGIPQSEWNKSNDLVLIEEIEQTLSFLNSPEGCVLNDKPNKIVFKQYDIPTISDIGVKSSVQYQDIKLLINDFETVEGNDIDIPKRLSLYTKIVATYLQPIIDKDIITIIDGKEVKGAYDFAKADEYAIELYKHSAMEVSAWGNFFIQRFKELRNGTLKDAQKLIMNQKKQKQGFPGYLKKWVGGLFSTRLAGQTSESTTK